MTTTDPAARRPSFLASLLAVLVYALCAAFLIAGLFLMWPALKAEWSGSALAQPTAVIRPQVAPVALPRLPEAAPAIPGIAQNAATAQAMYEATAAAADGGIAPRQNVTNDSAPVVREQRATDRQPAGDNVPTAEPVQEGESGIFGSKPVVVAPQETHECRHGQVWIDGKGCKNP